MTLQHPGLLARAATPFSALPSHFHTELVSVPRHGLFLTSRACSQTFFIFHTHPVQAHLLQEAFLHLHWSQRTLLPEAHLPWASSHHGMLFPFYKDSQGLCDCFLQRRGGWITPRFPGQWSGGLKKSGEHLSLSFACCTNYALSTPLKPPSPQPVPSVYMQGSCRRPSSVLYSPSRLLEHQTQLS